MNNNCYHNKNIVIIGASFGIGQALFEALDQAGANLIISARSQEKIQALAKDHKAIACDVTDSTQTTEFYHKVCQTFSHIDLIIFCVGIYKPMNIDNFDLSQSKAIIDSNCNSLLNVINAFMPLIKDKKLKHLAVTSSVAGYFGMPNSMAYGASKAALSNLTESLYYELAPYHTKVQLINPGFVKTRLTDQNSFAMPQMISAQKAAQIILKQLPKKKFEIRFPFAFAFMMKCLALLPYCLRLFIFKKVKS